MALRSFPGYNCQRSAQEYPSSAHITFLWVDLAFLKLAQHLFTPFLNAMWQGSVTGTVLNCLQELSGINRLRATPAQPCMGSTNPKWPRSNSSTVSLCLLQVFPWDLSVSGGFPATYLDVLLGSVCSPSFQQCHRAASEASPSHPAAINPIDFQGCCHQLVQLRAAHFIVIPGERRAVLCPVLHPGHNHCTTDSSSSCPGAATAVAVMLGAAHPGPALPRRAVSILGHPHLRELWLSTISLPNVL